MLLARFFSKSGRNTLLFRQFEPNTLARYLMTIRDRAALYRARFFKRQDRRPPRREEKGKLHE